MLALGSYAAGSTRRIGLVGVVPCAVERSWRSAGARWRRWSSCHFGEMKQATSLACIDGERSCNRGQEVGSGPVVNSVIQHQNKANCASDNSNARVEWLRTVP